MNNSTATRIAHLFYDAARQRFDAIVEFFTPGLAHPLCIPVTLELSINTPHPQLARALYNEARRRGIDKW
ncbi:hypothetical protein [Albirhodobacter sp. R86504]|jgi:hypothetical protein|uniref:hypothetical protein n=1 Tax=Albirhodobacter sp. R86504 TaxID=3093848 RepID=UPI0036717D0A